MIPLNNRQSQNIRFNYNGATGSGFHHVNSPTTISNRNTINNRSTAVTFGRNSQLQQQVFGPPDPVPITPSPLYSQSQVKNK